jgi:Concanavalin A-like lectin/glucanases superfamily
VIAQYGYNGNSKYDVEVKVGGGLGISATIAVTDPRISSMTLKSLLPPDRTFTRSSISLGGISLDYKFGGLSATISGTGSATGDLRFGSTQRAGGTMALIYSTPSGYSRINTYEAENVEPNSKSTLSTTSPFSVALELQGVQNFKISYYGVVDLSFDATLTGTVSYSLGSSGSASVAVYPDYYYRKLNEDEVQETATQPSELNFIPGETTVVLFKYSGFNPSEDIILFYSIKTLGSEHQIMQRNFTTSKSGSGVFEGIWSVPWDFSLSGKGANSTQIIVKASNSIEKKFDSEPFGITMFTETDGIFSSPSTAEAIPVGKPYTLRWTSDFLHYFKPAYWGAELGEEVITSEVIFEIVAERILPNGLVNTSVSYRNLTQGPVPNIGECVVTFPRTLLGMGDRFYINVISTNNSDTHGWSADYFTLHSVKKGRSRSPSTTRPATIKSEKMSYHASQRSVETLSNSVSDSRSEARRALGGCPAGQAAISFEAKGGLVGKDASIFTFTIPFSSSVSFTLLNTDTRCIAGPSASPAPRPVAATYPVARPVAPVPKANPYSSAYSDSTSYTYGATYGSTGSSATDDTVDSRKRVNSPPDEVIKEATLNHRYNFNDLTAADSIGSSHGTIIGSTAVIQSSRSHGQALFNGDGVSGILLPTNILKPTVASGATAFSIEMWASTDIFDINSGDCSKLFEFGDENSDYSDQTLWLGSGPCQSGDALIAGFAPGVSDCKMYSSESFDGQSNLHLVLTFALGGSVNLYISGVLAISCRGKISSSSYSTATSTPTNYLGRALLSESAGLSGSIDEFRIWNGELSAESVRANYLVGPDSLPDQTPFPTSAPRPSPKPTHKPTLRPSPAPSLKPTSRPTRAPTRLTPAPTSKPSLATSTPTREPIATPRPTRAPTRLSRAPTRVPTSKPSLATSTPTREPIATPRPTRAPTRLSRAPTRVPTSKFRPSRAPTNQPSSSSDDDSSSYSANNYQTYGQTYG